MAAATHMVGSAHSSASISPPPPPCHPVVIVPNHQHQALYDDLDLTPSPSPSPFPTTPATASPARHNHYEQHLRPACRRRRPRPSRKLPTTYIRADAASFRRMVHQVTGADDGAAHQDQAATVELLCRPAPLSRAALTTTTTMILPTLDTSALLFGAAERAGGATPARPAGASCCHGSAVPAVGDPGAALQAEEACGRGGVRGTDYSCSYSNDDGSAGGGFPSLDDKAIFHE